MRLGNRMSEKKGLTISKALFDEKAKTDLADLFPDIFRRFAAGLVGNGSECFGYDDEISEDHDWGADFYIWLPEDLTDRIQEVKIWKKAFMEGVSGYPLRKRSRYGADPSVVLVGDFYSSLIGYPQGPETAREWMSVPENNLALAVNGEVFLDNDGSFSEIRERLKKHYPEEVLLKRMAARCMMMAQTGQYNLLRCHKRNDEVAANLTLSRFIEQTIWMVHLLNHRYTPFYKWAFRSLKELPILGTEIAERIRILYGGSGNPNGEMEETAEEICRMIADELRSRGLTVCRDDYLVAHAEQLGAGIRDPFLKSLPLQIG